MTKSLYERVLEWEKSHGLASCSDEYNDRLRLAESIARQNGFKPYGNKCSGAFVGDLYTNDQTVIILQELSTLYHGLGTGYQKRIMNGWRPVNPRQF